MGAKIKAELVTGRDLAPGDLFSVEGPRGQYEGTLSGRAAGFGTPVFIRSNNRYDEAVFPPDKIYRITIITTED